ncbi:hypothetical protein GCM10018966_093330 [Streptomyces yanii]
MRNPDAIPFTCPRCGAETKANRRTGRLYSHQAPGKLLACGASDSQIMARQRGKSLTLPPLREPKPPEVPTRAAPVTEGHSTSVRTVSGGLPSLGRRR